MEFLEVPIFDDDIYKLMVRFGFNLFFVAMIIGLAYFPKQNRKPYAFTFLMMNVMVFFICFTLKKLDLGLGMALGLFAIFAIIRFRTDAIRVKEMSYLFIVVGIAVINALSNKKTSYAELVFANTVILGATIFLEYLLFSTTKLETRSLVYDNLKLLRPENHQQLIDDVRERIGIDAEEVEIKKIDLKAGTGNIVVHYDSRKQK